MIQRHNVLAKLKWLQTAAVCLILTSIGAGTCQAQCVPFSERAATVDVTQFSREPGSLLTRMRNDKEKLTERLTGYLVTDPGLLSSVRALVQEARTSDREAIGAALRHAESQCVASKPEAARKIKEFVQKLGDQTVTSGYSAAAEETTAISPVAKKSNRGAPLMSGEWGTEPSDPFAPVPIPQ